MRFEVLVLSLVVGIRASCLDTGRFLPFFFSPADSPSPPVRSVSGQGLGYQVAI